MYIYMHTILAYIRDLLTYMRQVAIHMMDYVDAATPKTESEFKTLSPPENPHSKRSLLPVLEDALKWLTGTATTKDTWEIKQCSG